MAGNQRENARKAKKRNKEAKIQRIIWAAIILVAAILVVMKIVEVDFNSIKDKYIDKNGDVNVSDNVEMSVYPYELDSSGGVKMMYQGDMLNILTDTSCTVIDPKDAQPLNTFNHGYANPVVKCADNYFVTYDQGGTRLRLDNLKKNEYKDTTEEPVLCADVSQSGDVIYATSSKDSKSCIYVLSPSMKVVMKHEVNTGYVVAVAIDSTGKRCAYATVNTKNAKFITTLYTINVGDEGERASFEYPGVNVLDLKYSSGDLYFVGDNCVYTVTSQKKQHEAFKAGTSNTVCFCYTKDGELLYVYSDYSSANENHLVNISTTGRARKKIELSKRPKYISSVANEICVLFGDGIKVFSLTSGDDKGSFKCDDSVSCAYKLSSRVYVVKGRQLDVIEE